MLFPSGLRDKISVRCYTNVTVTAMCKPVKEPCLFHIEEDPCELNNVARTYPNILADMLGELAIYRKSAVPPQNLPLDPSGNPKYWDNVWTNFGDSPK